MNDNRPVAFSAQRAPARSSRVLPRSSRERASSPVIGDRDGDGGARCARRDARDLAAATGVAEIATPPPFNLRGGAHVERGGERPARGGERARVRLHLRPLPRGDRRGRRQRGRHRVRGPRRGRDGHLCSKRQSFAVQRRRASRSRSGGIPTLTKRS